jgi:hypothetical protein
MRAARKGGRLQPGKHQIGQACQGRKQSQASHKSQALAFANRKDNHGRLHRCEQDQGAGAGVQADVGKRKCGRIEEQHKSGRPIASVSCRPGFSGCIYDQQHQGTANQPDGGETGRVDGTRSQGQPA